LLISIRQIPFFGATFNNADPLCALVITPGFYLPWAEMANQYILAAIIS